MSIDIISAFPKNWPKLPIALGKLGSFIGCQTLRDEVILDQYFIKNTRFIIHNYYWLWIVSRNAFFSVGSSTGKCLKNTFYFKRSLQRRQGTAIVEIRQTFFRICFQKILFLYYYKYKLSFIIIDVVIISTKCCFNDGNYFIGDMATI